MIADIFLYALSNPTVRLYTRGTGTEVGTGYTASPVGTSLSRRTIDFGSLANGEYDLESTSPPGSWAVSVVGGVAYIFDNWDQIEMFLRGILRGSVTTGSTTTSVATTGLSPALSVADQVKNRVIVFDRDTTTAALRGQAATITASTSGGVLTVSTLTNAPASGDTFMIV